jgi:hypothetical protein
MGKYHVRVRKRGKKIWLILIDSNPSEKKNNIKRATGTWQAWTSGNPFHPTLANVLISAKMRSFPVKFCSRPSLIVPFLMGKGGGGMTMRVGGGSGCKSFFT